MMARRIAILLCLLFAASTVVVGAIAPSTGAWIAHDIADKRVLVQIYCGRVLVYHLRWLDCGFCSGKERRHAASCPLLVPRWRGCGMSGPPIPWIQYTSPTTDFLQHDPGAPRNALLGARWDKWRSPEAGNVTGVCSECGVPLRPGPQERSTE